jgi:hypothetical protein
LSELCDEVCRKPGREVALLPARAVVVEVEHGHGSRVELDVSVTGAGGLEERPELIPAGQQPEAQHRQQSQHVTGMDPLDPARPGDRPPPKLLLPSP